MFKVKYRHQNDVIDQTYIDQASLITQNGQTYFRNAAAFAARFLSSSNRFGTLHISELYN